MTKHRELDLLVKKALKNSLSQGKLVDGQLKITTQQFLDLPKGQAIYALSRYLKLLKAQVRQQVLEIETASTLNSREVADIAAAFEDHYQINEIKVTQNSSLVAGIRIKIGDDIFEDTVDSRVKQVKQAIIS